MMDTDKLLTKYDLYKKRLLEVETDLAREGIRYWRIDIR